MATFLFVLTGLAAFPAAALAQAAMAGSVTDPSGAPVPGVMVEATSPALLEKTRTGVTDADGRYRIEALRPGLYQVRFGLAGWKAQQLEGVVVDGAATVTVDGQLSIGDLTETVTVAAADRPIDVHGAARSTSLSGDLIRALPTVRGYNALLALVPGVVTSANDIVTGPAATSFPLHGGRPSEGRVMRDGLTIGSPPSGNSATIYDVDVGRADAVTFTISGGLGEAETAGLVMNIVAAEGGNTTHGSAFVSGSGERLQSDNLTPELIALGVTPGSPSTNVYDVAMTLGGPVMRDRLWYFVSGHRGGSTKQSASVHYNLNAGDPGAWLYAPDLARPAYSDRMFESVSGRVSWQATPRNKVVGFWDWQAVCRSCTGATPGLQEPQQSSPEAVGVLGRRLDVTQLAWSSPLTSHLLFEAAYGGTHFGVGNFERDPNPTRDLVRVVEQCAAGCAANGGIPGLAYRSQDFSDAHVGSYTWKGSASFVTGTRSLKVGYQQTLMTDERRWMTNTHGLTYRVSNGVPNQLTQSISPWVNDARAGWQAAFVQGQWTRHGLTVQGAVRFDRARSWFPVQTIAASRFLPSPLVVPATTGVDSYKDITPRLGVAYDVFGTGRTAIKFSLGRYLEGVGVSGIYAATNPTLRTPRTTQAFGTPGVTRAWTDDNGNFAPDCDLLNAAAQDLRASGGDRCGVMSNVDFGRLVLTNAYDPALLSGWRVRPSDWNVVLAIQQEIGRRMSIDVSYHRRSFHGFTVADNLAVGAADLTPFSVVAPIDPRLPGGGGYVVGGLYDVVPARAGQVDNLIGDSRQYGRWDQYFNGVDVIVDARLAGRFTLAGGTSTGQTVADNCGVRRSLPELATTSIGTSPFGAGLAVSQVTPASPYCHVAFGVLTQVRGLSSYLVPKLDVQVAATFQSKPGALLAANYAVPNADVVASLGRDLSAGASTVTVNLVTPGSMYGDRINQVDLRVGKVLKYGGTRTVVGLDVYNVANASAVLTYDNTFVPGGAWLKPLAILTPRLFRITAEVDW